MLCYRCGGHVKDGTEKCPSCGQPFALGLKPGSIAGFGTGSRRGRAAADGAPYKIDDAVAGRFQIKDHLGAGPLGWVFRATDTESGESVALKVLSPRFLQLPEEQATFLSEMERVQPLEHANIAKNLAAGLDGARPWIASQLLEGLTLRRIMELRKQKSQGFSLPEIEPIIAQIAAGLEAAPMAHGDLKPENVIVLPDLLELTDFGLAHSLPRLPFVAAQRAGGVQRYFAPEVLAGTPMTPRSDVFSLGAILGELLGGAPFDAQLEVKVRAAGTSSAVERVFLRAVAPRPHERFASAMELSLALTDAIHGGPGPLDEDDVIIEDAQTDPRVRMARALAAQDAERAARKRLEAQAKKAAAAELPASLQLSLTPLPAFSVPPLSMPPLTLEPFSMPPRADLPPRAEPAARAEPIARAEPTSAVPQATAPALPLRPSSDDETTNPGAPLPTRPTPIATNAPELSGPEKATDVSRVAASIDAPASLLTAETAVRAAPAVALSAEPEEPAAAPDSAPPAQAPEVAEQHEQEAAQLREPAPDAAQDVPEAPLVSEPPPDAEDASAERGSRRRSRGRKGKHEGRGSKSARSSAPPAEGDSSAPPASVEDAPVEKARVQPPPPPPPTRPPPARASAAPLSFGAPVEEKRGLSVPVIAIGAVVVIALLVFGWSQLSSHDDVKEGAAPKSAAAALPAPGGATASPSTAADAGSVAAPNTAAAPTPTAPSAPVVKEPPRPAPEPLREPELRPNKSGKKSFLDRLRERRESRKHGHDASGAEVPEQQQQERAPAPGAVGSDPAAQASNAPATAAPAPAPTPSAPSPVAAQPCAESMTLISAGSAHIGTDAADDMHNFGDRAPRTVTLKSFCIDLYEWPNQAGKLPRVAVGFSEADASCKKLGKRLCSEDEWEKACKGPGELRFPYGNAFSADACNTQDAEKNPRKLVAAGAFASCKSGYGIFDLSGNAAEWTASAFEGAGGDRTVKGGSATRPDFDDRCASRRRLASAAHDINVGFRCCSDATS